MTAFFSWWFLKDMLTQKQILLMAAAFAVLVCFVFAEKLLGLL
jgi:hypothetical protein